MDTWPGYLACFPPGMDAWLSFLLPPRQATEFVVDLALRYNRPFAVVPCCVYACEFPGRRLRGRPVRKYEQFIEYLVSKAPRRIRVAQLPFEGKNKVVYCL